MPLVLNGATSGSTTLQATDAVTVTCTLPSTGGTLQTSGSGYTANGVAYASSTSALATGSNLVWDSTNSRLGIGTSSPITALEVYGVQQDSSNTGNIRSIDNTTLGANKGGGILFGGYYTGTSPTAWSAISGLKNNSTDGDYGGYLSFRTRANGGSLSENMRLDSSGNLGLGVTPNTWSLGKAFEIGSSGNALWSVGTGELVLGMGFYYNGNFKYSTTGIAVSIYDQYRGAHQWYVAPSGTAGSTISLTQAMTLDNSGNLLVGTTSTSPSTLGIKFSMGSGGTIRVANNGSDDGIDYYNTVAGAYRFYIDSAGTIHATSIVITAISDQRLKENIRDIETGLSSIMALKPRRFDWKEGKGQNKKNAAGFIADEFEEVFPESVSTSKAGDDGIEYKNISHETLIPTLVKAIQEQQTLIQSLTDRLTVLETK